MNNILYNSSERSVWLSTLKKDFRAAFQIDRSKLTAGRAVRSVIAFILPLAIGVETGHIAEGVSMAGAAAMLGTVRLDATYYARVRTMLLTCVAISIAAFVGSITGRIDWLAILIIGIWSFGAGLLVSLGEPATTSGTLSTIALIVLSQFWLGLPQAVIQAGFMLAGALLQTVISIIPLPWQHTASEQSMLSTAYQTLANYASDPSNEQVGRQAHDSLLQTYSTLADSNVKTQKGKIFLALLEEAERIRLNLIALVILRQSLSTETDRQRGAKIYLDEILQASAVELQNIANELKPVPPPIVKVTGQSGSSQQLEQLLTLLLQQEILSYQDKIIQQIRYYGDNLRTQLQRAGQLATASKNPQPLPQIDVSIPPPPRPRLNNAWATLRANLTPRSAACQHSMRLALGLMLATALYRIFLPLPIQNGYWMPLTVLIVLKPDFTSTFTSGVALAVGTILGAVLTTFLISILVPTKEILVIVDAIMTYLAFAVVFANYAIHSVFITMQTVFLITFVNPQPRLATLYRAIDTVTGSVLALLIYALWPTWEHSQLPYNLANRLETLRRYLVAVLEAYTDPRKYNHRELNKYRIESRLAHSNAEASVQRSLQEPAPQRIDSDLVKGLLDAMNSIDRSALALDAHLIEYSSRYTIPALASFTQQVNETLRILTTAIRENQDVPAFPDLQKALQTLEIATRPGDQAQQDANPDLSIVLTECRNIVHNINIINQLLSRKLKKEEI